jgi:membrane dipeptidase
MKHPFRLLVVLLSTVVTLGISQQSDEQALRAKARSLAEKFIIVDTHIDAPEELLLKWQDISKRISSGEFDYPRAKEGGLKAPFMSIYTSAEEDAKGTAYKSAEAMIDLVNKFANDWPDKFAVATSVSDVTAIAKSGKIALCMGMENGAPIEDKLERLAYFHKRGIRYVTLTHGKDNRICDSSYDTTHTWHGISPFGETVVAEMNRLGIMVDISHVSDDAFYKVMKITKAPAIASHSSCRYFTPGFERNMSDDMIKVLAKNGGVIQINFGSDFLNEEYRQKETAGRREVEAYLKSKNLSWRDSAGHAYVEEYRKQHPIGYADVKDAVAHIDHVVKLVGVDHVGIGSDFDGVGDSLPIGLKDVSQYPNLIFELLKIGYSDSDIQKICGGNLLQVWSQVEKLAKK